MTLITARDKSNAKACFGKAHYLQLQSLGIMLLTASNLQKNASKDKLSESYWSIKCCINLNGQR